jgi:SAM-dependent methyltransferase
MSISRVAKQQARRLSDRVVTPYVDKIRHRRSANVGSEADGTEPAGDERPGESVSEFFHMANHALRTHELERVPKGARVALSVGAGGRWYFDWFEEHYGPLERHIGIEAFEPEPDDLPGYAVWIPDTANHMDRVQSGSVDLVFAGQTSEHLWAEELAGFLLEAHRVLTPGGLLALDSPNRLVTEHLLWSHGGHTIELAAGEMEHLLELAGFDVETVAGVWRCVDRGRRLQLEEGLDDPMVLVRRTATGREAPDECFVWWINARRSTRDPRPDDVRAEVQRLFDEHWNTRVSRGLFPEPGGDRLRIGPGAGGRIASTLPFPLHGGDWTVSASLLDGDWDSLAGFRLVIMAPPEELVHELTLDAATFDAERRTATWTVRQPYLLFALILHVEVDSVASAAELALPLDIRAPVPTDAS